MLLHRNVELFNQLITEASNLYEISTGVIRKDYFVSLFLKEYHEVERELIFKGGTSLTKCHQVIERFSEDIDITFISDGKKLSEGQRRRVNHNVLNTCEKLGYTVMNPESIRSKRKFNAYHIDTGFLDKESSLRDFIIVEVALQTLPFPVTELPVHTYLGDYLVKKEAFDVIQKYQLEPFDVLVQDMNRTFIDKVFAICDYYLEEAVDEKSRHIYDLYKLWPSQKMEITSELIQQVKETRKDNVKCLSVINDLDINTLLTEIKEKEIYKSDYDINTRNLLFEKVTYDEAIKVLDDVIMSGLFNLGGV